VQIKGQVEETTSDYDKEKLHERLAKLAGRAAVITAGGAALLRTSTVITVIKCNDDQDAGINIVRRALQSPARQIATNAGAEASIVVGKILESKNANYGYNAQTGEYGDMVTMGIVDPVKVVRTALQDAASVAPLLITTEAMVAELPKKEAGGGGMPGGGMGGGGMGGMDF
jgi:chaperonin GroEL